MLKDIQRSRIEIVEALRGFAALSVAWYHFTNGGGLLKDGWLKASGSYGWLGVEMFFVISGFIIPYSMHQGGYRFQKHFAVFLLKRIIRLDPPYLIAAILSLFLWHLSSALPGFAGAEPQVSAVQLLLHLGYLNTFFGYPWLNIVFWSLAIEFQFYILLALTYPLLSHKTPSVRVVALTAICGSAFLLPDTAFVFHYAGLFVLGIVTYWKFASVVHTPVYAVIALAATLVTTMTLGLPSALVGLTTSIAIAYVHMPRYGILAFFGSLSYSLYLVHVPIGGRVVNFGKRFVASSDSILLYAAVLFAAVVASLIAAYVMHNVVERPAQKWSAIFGYSS